MIDYNRKIIFSHFPRTGGGTIEAAFKWGEVIRREANNFHNFHHRNFQNQLQEIQQNNFDHKDFFKFTCARNPWDIMVSRFFFDKFQSVSTTENNKILFGEIKKMDFDKYVEWRLQENPSFLNIEPFIFSGNIKVDKIIRFESYKEDVSELFEKFNINLNYRRVNTSLRPKDISYKSFYTNLNTKNLVESHAKSFIDILGYKFED